MVRTISPSAIFFDWKNLVLICDQQGPGESLLLYEMLPAELKEIMKGFVWIGPSAPHPIHSDRNLTALPLEGWQGINQGLRNNRVSFTRNATAGVFGIGAPEQGGRGIEMHKMELEFYEQIVRMADSRA
jgi:hypothetical protein